MVTKKNELMTSGIHMANVAYKAYFPNSTSKLSNNATAINKLTNTGTFQHSFFQLVSVAVHTASVYCWLSVFIKYFDGR